MFQLLSKVLDVHSRTIGYLGCVDQVCLWIGHGDTKKKGELECLKTCNKAQKTMNTKIIESGMKKSKKEGEST